MIDRLEFFKEYRSEQYLKEKKVDKFYGDNNLAKSVIRSKYLHEQDEDNLAFFWFRLVSTIWQKQFDIYNKEKYTLLELYETLEDWKYVFGGRINYALGVEGINSSYSNCYYVGIEHDSLYGIYHALGRHGLTYGKGGGVGHNITILRPRDCKVEGSGSVSPGSFVFMDLYSANTGTIAQHGRRGANLQAISCWHPDVIDFLNEKNDNFYDYIQQIKSFDKFLAKKINDDFSDQRKVSFSNVSIEYDDEFMRMVEEERDIQLFFPDIDSCEEENDSEKIEGYKSKLLKYYIFFDNMSYEEAKVRIETELKEKPITIYDTRWDGDLQKWKNEGYPIKVYKTINAKRDVWDLHMRSAWKSAEPGVLFKDRFVENWTMRDPFRGTNPCGEIGMPDGAACLIAHIVLWKYWTGSELDWESIEKDTYKHVFMQDIILNLNLDKHALGSQSKIAYKYRQIGIGITGFSDLLIYSNIAYDSVEAIGWAEEIAKRLEIIKWKASIALAKEIGSFPGFDLEVMEKSLFFQKMPDDIKQDVRKYGIRNSTLSTVAPVGTGSIITESEGSGIEPLFSTYFERRVKQDDGSYKKHKIYSRLITKVCGTDFKKLPPYVVTSHDVHYKRRILMQAAWQKWTGNSISSTINLSEDTPIETINDIYLLAWKYELKGVTVYREGSRAGILLSSNKESGDLVLGHADKSPERLPAIRIKRRAEGKKYYFIITFQDGDPYEVFVKTNAHTTSSNTETAILALIDLVTVHGVAGSVISDQLTKHAQGKQSNTERVCRFVSLALRHKISLPLVVKTLLNLEMGVTSVIYHIAKVLSEWIPDGTSYGEDKNPGWVFEGGCVVNKFTGESKC